MSEATDDEGPSARGIECGGQFADGLPVPNVVGGERTHGLDVHCLEFGEFWVESGAVQQDRGERVGEVVVDEEMGASAFPSAPIGLGGKVRIGDRVPKSVVEAVVDRREETTFGSEVVIERSGTELGAAGERAELEQTVAADQLVAGSGEKLLTSDRGPCHSPKHNRTQLCYEVAMSTQVSSLVDLAGDLAGTYRRTASSGATVDPAIADADLAAVQRDGYVILPDLLTSTELDEVREAIAPYLDRRGRNNFEGHTTQRVYSVLNKTSSCDRIADHPRVLAILDRLLMPNYLLSMLQAINILPGEQRQMLHCDDSFYPLPRPRAALSAATIWAIDDFTADNGATDIIPGSHLWGHEMPADLDRKPVVMSAGSCVFFLGTLWHGGGANRTQGSRLALTAQYCEPWLRTQEAFALSMTKETVRRVSEDIRRMLGYSIHPPFVGQVDGMHPKRLLEDD